MKIRYKKNGFIGHASESVAKKLIEKGKAELVKTEKIEDPKPKAKKVTVR